MKKSKIIAFSLLIAFLGISSMPLWVAPASPIEQEATRFLVFENGEEHSSHWLLRSISENEELNTRNTAEHHRHFVNPHGVAYTSEVSKVRLIQNVQFSEAKRPKQRLYLVHSLFLI
ncbi:MAG: hypothetical protein JNJ65_08005 [Cyclobacteriaceae bacterium]|nr:hypothetical protein [Cyclobacteriaceae bacterium]